jgi:hypothetical protein
MNAVLQVLANISFVFFLLRWFFIVLMCLGSLKISDSGGFYKGNVCLYKVNNLLQALNVSF